MADAKALNAESQIKSPCMNLCCLDDEDVCIGCHRSVKEITGWSRMDYQQKKATMVKVIAREQASGRMMN